MNVANTLINDEWHYYTVTLDSSGFAKMYRDAELVGSKALVVPANVSRTYNYIGRGNWPGDSTYEGYLDEFEIANTAYSESKIKELYLKTGFEDFGKYESSVLDFESSSSGVNGFSWLDSGVGTGNGEIPYSTTGLVAQWNFNETSGTVVSSDGSCGSACNGTLINSVTTGQDDDRDSGWTYENRKWGEGAVKLDGVNDYISVADNSQLDMSGDITIETWIKLDTNTVDYQTVLSKRVAGVTNANYGLRTGAGTDTDETAILFYGRFRLACLFFNEC